METIFSIHSAEPKGDVLAFLTGQEEVCIVESLFMVNFMLLQVDTAVRQINDRARLVFSRDEHSVQALPMYGGLPQAEQMKVVHKHSD